MANGTLNSANQKWNLLYQCRWSEGKDWNNQIFNQTNAFPTGAEPHLSSEQHWCKASWTLCTSRPLKYNDTPKLEVHLLGVSVCLFVCLFVCFCLFCFYHPWYTLNTSMNPFTPNFPAASPEILHHIVWRTWHFLAYKEERWLYYQFALGECTFWTWEWRS